MLDLDRERVEVAVAIAEGEELALSQARERREQDEIAVRRDRVRSELLGLAPVEEAHLGLLTPRRLDPEDAFVDEVPALFRVGEHLLKHAQRELGLPRSAASDRGDVVLDCGRANLVERDLREDVEVRQDLADSRERRGTDAQRVTLEPAGGELAERLGRRLVERTERRAALLLEDETLGVLLEREGARARAAVDADPAGAVALAPVLQPVRLDMGHGYSNSLG